jgi:hypothetical protein
MSTITWRLQPAAYDAVSQMAAADATGSPHKAATQGSIALASATGPIGTYSPRSPRSRTWAAGPWQNSPTGCCQP